MKVGEQLREMWRQARQDMQARPGRQARAVELEAEAEAARKTLALPAILSPVEFPGKHLPKPTPMNLARAGEADAAWMDIRAGLRVGGEPPDERGADRAGGQPFRGVCRIVVGAVGIGVRPDPQERAPGSRVHQFYFGFAQLAEFGACKPLQRRCSLGRIAI